MIRFDRAAIAAALTLAVTPVTAHAATDAAYGARRTVSAHVSVHDLDLASANGQRTFASRVRRAAAQACGMPLDLRDRIDAMRCRTEMMKDGGSRLASRAASRTAVLAAIDRRPSLIIGTPSGHASGGLPACRTALC